MAVTIPSNPQIGDLWTVGDVQYTWDGTGWDRPSVNSDFIHEDGDTMLGDLVLNADPTLDLGAATKHYVDNPEYGVITHFPVRATITNPSLGIGWSRMTWKHVGNNEYKVTAQVHAINGTDGNGKYLFDLPNGLSFSSNYIPTTADPWLPNTINILPDCTGSWGVGTINAGGGLVVVPHDTTTFSLAMYPSTFGGGTINRFIRSDNAGLAVWANCSYVFSFTFLAA